MGRFDSCQVVEIKKAEKVFLKNLLRFFNIYIKLALKIRHRANLKH